MNPLPPALTPDAPLPPVLAGHVTPQVQKKVERFYSQLAALFDLWVQRRQSPHTQRAYREDVMHFVRFMSLVWPQHADFLLAVSLHDVQAWREDMLHKNLAPKTLNRRIASLSS